MTNYSTVSIYNRYYEVNEMDLTVAKTKTKIKNTGMTYVSIFGLTLLLGLVKIYDTSLCFVLPIGLRLAPYMMPGGIYMILIGLTRLLKMAD